jgi:hypothetical protein
MVAVNVLQRDYAGLLKPLLFYQVAPALFLWAERGATEWLGASTWTLRLIPVVCAVAAVPAFRSLAVRLAPGWPAAIALAIFAVSYHPIRHGAEVKPYAADLLVSLLLLGAGAAWLATPSSRRAPMLLAAILPVGLGFSHPSAFVGAGVVGAVGWKLWAGGDRPTRLRWLGVAAVLLVSFGSWYMLATAGQSGDVGTIYREGYWADSFPPLSQPWKLPGWLLWAHTGEAFGYPIGGDGGASLLTALLLVAGVRALWLAGRRDVLALVLAPLGMTLLAACLGKYPYAGAARTMQHIAPTVCLLAGIGAERVIGWIGDHARARRVRLEFLGLLAVVGLGHVFIDLTTPYRTREDLATRDFARWFWAAQGRDGARVVCAKQAAGIEFEGKYWKLGRWELYLAYRDLLGTPPTPANPGQTVRCVVFNDDPSRNPGLAAWLRRMGESHRAGPVREYKVNPGIFDKGMPREEKYLVYEFTAPAAGPGSVAAAPRGPLPPSAARR